MKMSSFLIAILLVSIPVLGFTLFATLGGTSYGFTYSDTTTGLNQYSAINSTIVSMNTEIKNDTLSSGGFAIIGDYLGYGKRIFTVGLTSINTFTTMSDVAYQNVASGTTNTQASGALRTIEYVIISIVIIAIFFIFMALVAGRNSL